MDEDVQNLVLAPFKGMVEKGTVAVEQGKDGDQTTWEQTRKFAQNLIKEGGRALKKLEPLCKKQWEEYGANFVAALKENDEIAKFRTDLNSLLWDFEAFIEEEDVDAEELAELQSLPTLARTAAKAIYEILMRLKLKHPTITFADFDSAGVSRSTSFTNQEHTPILTPHGTPVPEEEEAVQDSSSAEPAAVDTPRMTTMTSQAGPDLGYNPGLPHPVLEIRFGPDRGSNANQEPQTPRAVPESPAPQPRTAETIPIEERPAEPAINPWDLPIRPIVSPETGESVTVRRRPRVSSTDDEQAVSQPGKGSNAFGETDGADERTTIYDEGIAGITREIKVGQQSLPEGSTETATPSTPERPSHVRNLSSRDDRTLLPSHTMSPSSPLHPPPALHVANNQTAANHDSPRPGPIVPPTHRNSQGSSFQSSISSEAARRDSLMSSADNPVSPVQAASVGGLVPQRNSQSSIPEDQPVMSAGWSSPRPASYQVMDQPGLIPIERTEEQPGLMLVPGDQSRNRHPPIVTREPNCNITIDSSFDQLKGFCDSAKDIIRGGAGVRKVRKLVGTGSHTVAKCKSCLFELDWAQVEADYHGSEQSNHRNSSISFRLRFISKSHLPSRTVDEQLYGCLFCNQLGRTTEESDATVFFSQRQLFSHLARHPRPLPPVPGLMVIETMDIPPQFRNNYDLHLPHPPIKSLMVGLERELSQMPTAIATEAFRTTHGAIRTPPDGSPILQFCAGQKIVGVEFPSKYGGNGQSVGRITCALHFLLMSYGWRRRISTRSDDRGAVTSRPWRGGNGIQGTRTREVG